MVGLLNFFLAASLKSPLVVSSWPNKSFWFYARSCQSFGKPDWPPPRLGVVFRKIPIKLKNSDIHANMTKIKGSFAILFISLFALNLLWKGQQRKLAKLITSDRFNLGSLQWEHISFWISPVWLKFIWLLKFTVWP